MTQLFRAANCSQCGGALDLKTLRCQFCGVQSVPLNFTTAIPEFVRQRSERQRLGTYIPMLDNMFLTLLQMEALTQGVEVVLTRYDNERVFVYVALEKSQVLSKVGEVVTHNQRQADRPWNVYYGGDRIYWPFSLAVGWEQVVGDGNVVIFKTADNLWQTKNFDKYLASWHTEDHIFRSANDLFLNFEAMREAAKKMVYYASWEIREEETERKRRAKIDSTPQWLRPLAELFY